MSSVGFGVPNGDVDGLENDYVAEPSVTSEDPFDGGVENGDRPQDVIHMSSSSTHGTFLVDEPIGDDEDNEGGGPVYVTTSSVAVIDDPSIVVEPEVPETFEELDDMDVIAGGDDFQWVQDRGEESDDLFFDVGQDLIFEPEHDDFSDLDLDEDIVFGDDWLLHSSSS